MHIKIKKVILHNFLSYGHAEVELEGKHYCLVSGINNDKKDNATSNGAGKSSWGSAISFALTGETIQGVSSGLKNLNIAEDLCYVELEFSVDKDEYKITRYKNPKSDLKIIVNDKDVSGKGIRESEAVLNKYLPDLTSQLIGSIIILGQGLPYKFSNNTPSGRKEVLEKLSKSDFMIQDLKDRVAERSKNLGQQLRTVEDELLSISSKKSVLSKQIEEQLATIEALKKPRDFDSEIEQATTALNELTSLSNKVKLQIAENENKVNTKNSILNEKNEEKSKYINNENNDFNSVKTTYYERKFKLTAGISALNTRISEIKSIRDVCPTCGQRLLDVVKQSTETEEKEVVELTTQLAELNARYAGFEIAHNLEIRKIEQEYASETADIFNELRIIKQQTDTLRQQEASYTQLIIIKTTEINKISMEREQHFNALKNAENALNALLISVEKLDTNLLYNTKEKENISNHISVINQMNTLIKRDFRGYLLSNIISFIALKVKEYSIEIFGTDLLTFTLDGNNINISYCGKSFENLSGGEKQRTDLIIQFAIRDMMRQYLNFSSNILLLDEIFDSLDTTAVDAVLKCICNKLVDVDSLFIISHHARELEIPYDSELVVTKNESGISSVIWR